MMRVVVYVILIATAMFCFFESGGYDAIALNLQKNNIDLGTGISVEKVTEENSEPTKTIGEPESVSPDPTVATETESVEGTTATESSAESDDGESEELLVESKPWLVLAFVPAKTEDQKLYLIFFMISIAAIGLMAAVDRLADKKRDTRVTFSSAGLGKDLGTNDIQNLLGKIVHSLNRLVDESKANHQATQDLNVNIEALAQKPSFPFKSRRGEKTPGEGKADTGNKT